MAGRVKPGYTREFSGIPEKYPERARRYGALSHRHVRQLHQPRCAHVCAPPHVSRYKCQKAATAERVARLADGGGDDAVVPTYCFEIKEVIGMRFADPERLVGKKRRNELAAAETSLCYLTRGKFGEDQNDDGFIDTRWVELEELYDNCGKQNLNRALKAYRTAEKGGGRSHCRL